MSTVIEISHSRPVTSSGHYGISAYLEILLQIVNFKIIFIYLQLLTFSFKKAFFARFSFLYGLSGLIYLALEKDFKTSAGKFEITCCYFNLYSDICIYNRISLALERRYIPLPSPCLWKTRHRTANYAVQGHAEKVHDSQITKSCCFNF